MDVIDIIKEMTIGHDVRSSEIESRAAGYEIVAANFCLDIDHPKGGGHIVEGRILFSADGVENVEFYDDIHGVSPKLDLFYAEDPEHLQELALELEEFFNEDPDFPMLVYQKIEEDSPLYFFKKMEKK